MVLFMLYIYIYVYVDVIDRAWSAQKHCFIIVACMEHVIVVWGNWSFSSSGNYRTVLSDMLKCKLGRRSKNSTNLRMVTLWM